MRLHLRLSGSAEALLTHVGSKVNLKTRDVVLDALGLFSVAVREAEKGNRVGIMDSEGKFTAITTATLSALEDSTEKSPNGELVSNAQ